MNPTIAQIIANQTAIALAAQLELEKLDAENAAKNQKAEAAKAQACFDLLPDYLREYMNRISLEMYRGYILIQVPPLNEDMVPFAPIRAEFDNLHTQPKLTCYRLPRLVPASSEDNSAPELLFYDGSRTNKDEYQTPESALYAAYYLGAQYHEAMIAWSLAEPERIAARIAYEDAQQQATAVKQMAKDAQRERLVALAEVINQDPLLKPLFELLVGIVMERSGTLERINSLSDAMDEAESTANQRLLEVRRKAERAADDARRAQADAEDADARARRAEKQLKQFA